MSTADASLPKPDWREKLFLSETYSDCSILVKISPSNIRFPGHTVVLASASDVFAEIFEKSSEEKGRVIVMNDVNPHAVAKVLEYIYLGYVQINNWKFVSDMLKIAGRYKIMNLVPDCLRYLRKNITLQNVCYILEAAIYGNLEELEKECKSVCQEGAFVILNTLTFNNANLDTVKAILSNPDLHVQNEIVVFKAAWKWATYKCCKEGKTVTEENVANEMSSLFECIGFKHLSFAEMKSIPKVVLERFQNELGLKDEDRYLLSKVSNQKENGKSLIDSSLGSIKDSTKSSSEISSKRLIKERKLTFPLLLFNYSKSFLLDSVNDEMIHLPVNCNLMRFKVNTRVYLKCIRLDFTATVFVGSQTVSFRIHNKKGELISFSENISNPGDANLKFRKICNAPDLLILEADEVHTVEVDVGENSAFILWPRLSPKYNRLGNVEFTVLTKQNYGISQITFIETS